MSPAFRIANGVAVVLFLISAALQLGDADALIWVAVYAAAVIQCVLYAMGTLPRPLSLAFVVLCTPWSVVLAIQLGREGGPLAADVGREILGLAFAAGWTFVLWRRSGRAGLPENVGTMSPEP